MSKPVTDAMQDALAGEHAAAYAYSVIGGRLDYGTTYQELAARHFRDHRARRDALIALLGDAGADPVGADPAYELPVAVESDSDAQRVGQQVEDRCSVLYAGIVATATGQPRRFGVTALGEAAVAGLEWGAPPVALPGVESP
ncbi:MAG: ferritin-like domain-containing protein [Actinomycetia bacterium]|nr:ferritin-like domain-containing protein [Actinomycetes bacterium]